MYSVYCRTGRSYWSSDVPTQSAAQQKITECLNDPSGHRCYSALKDGFPWRSAMEPGFDSRCKYRPSTAPAAPTVSQPKKSVNTALVIAGAAALAGLIYLVTK